MRIALVLNTGAGTLRGADVAGMADRIAAKFRERGHRVVATFAEGRLAIAAVEKIAADKSADVIVVGGGDGTVSSAAAICARSGVALGVLPLGTMNFFARSLRIPLAPEAAAAALANGRLATVDIARVNGREFIHALSLGFHVALVEEREKTAGYRSRIEKMAESARSWWRVLRRPRRLSLAIRADDKTMERDTIGLVVSNNVLGRGHLPYADRLDGGTLGLYITRAESPAEIIGVTATAAVGLAELNPLVEHLASPAVAISFRRPTIKASVDGELVRLKGPLRVESVAGGLKVLAPAETR